MEEQRYNNRLTDIKVLFYILTVLIIQKKLAIPKLWRGIKGIVKLKIQIFFRWKVTLGHFVRLTMLAECGI